MDEKTTLIEALARAKLKFSAITRSETADTGKYKYKYATLDQMIEATQAALSDEGLVAYHTMRLDGAGMIVTMACHIVGHGAEIVAEVSMPYPVPDGRMNPVQSLGSLVTYLRRYTYGAGLGLAIEDDDDANRTPPEASKAPPRPATAKPAEAKAPRFSDELKSAFEAGKITDAERADLFAKATVIVKAARAAGKEEDLSALRAELSKKTAVHSDDELMY